MGPKAGLPPQFQAPSLSETAATPGLLITRWIVLLSLMCSVGLLVFRLVIARPLLRRVPDAPLRALSTALAGSLVVAVISSLVYVALTTAEFAQVSFFDLGATVPLIRDTESSSCEQPRFALRAAVFQGDAAIGIGHPQR